MELVEVALVGRVERGRWSVGGVRGWWLVTVAALELVTWWRRWWRLVTLMVALVELVELVALVGGGGGGGGW